MKPFLLFLLFLFSGNFSFGNVPAQEDSLKPEKNFFLSSTEPDRKKICLVTGSYATMYGGTMSGLYFLWYKNSPLNDFHLFNDYQEWLQMDKCGHATSAFYSGKVAYEVFRWSGLNKTKSIVYGVSAGYLFLSTVEVLDGLSQNWGFSIPDIAANTFGAGLFAGQMAAWNETRILMKFSFHQTGYSKYRPELLGSNFQENILKDYNGQTYWLSANIYSFLNKESKFPKWLNAAVGYGADGMLGGMDNVKRKDGIIVKDFSSTPRLRQFYVSLDVDLSKIKTKYLFLNTIIHTFGYLKVPAPALEYKQNGKFTFHPFYF